MHLSARIARRVKQRAIASCGEMHLKAARKTAHQIGDVRLRAAQFGFGDEKKQFSDGISLVGSDFSD
jgi:hypothetical protein